MTTGMPDFGELLAQIQQQMMDAQASLDDLRSVGTSGGGLVSATVDGHGDLVALTIQPEAYDADDPDALDTIADLVVAAVRDAKASSGLADVGDSLGGMLGGLLGGGAGQLDSVLEGLLPPPEQPEDR